MSVMMVSLVAITHRTARACATHPLVGSEWKEQSNQITSRAAAQRLCLYCLQMYGQFIESSVFELSARQVFTRATPLFEKERRSEGAAGALNLLNPLRAHRACARTAFSSYNRPMDAGQICLCY
jgi:hypothetical protein